MRETGRLLQKNFQWSFLYLCFSVAYILQAVLPNPDRATLSKYSLSVGGAKLLGLTIELPYILIWAASLIGYLRLKTYVSLIRKDKDGAAFKVIAAGILWLTLWLPVSAIAGNFFAQLYRYHPDSTANLVRLNVYLNLIILGVGFWLLYQGTTKLLPLIARYRFQTSLPIILGFVAFSVLYTFLTLHDPARSHATRSVNVASYYEPDWLIVTTTIIPRLLSWFLGIQAVHNLYLYNKKVKGKLYRSGLKGLALGLCGVIILTIVLRCLQSATTELEAFNLGGLLALIYLLLIIMGAAYALITKGAHALQKIEES